MSKFIEKRRKYYEKVFGKEDFALSRIHQESILQKIEKMQLSPSDSHILQFLTKSCNIAKAVEIGGLFGYSTLHIARGLSKDGHLYSVDIDLDRQKKSQELIENLPEFNKITWICGDARKMLNSIRNKGPFDLVFIDADKASYFDYLLWAEKNLKVGGIVIADNAFLFNTLYADSSELESLKKIHHVSSQSIESLLKFNKRITTSSHWKGAMIPTEDGMAVAYKLK